MVALHFPSVCIVVEVLLIAVCGRCLCNALVSVIGSGDNELIIYILLLIVFVGLIYVFDCTAQVKSVIERCHLCTATLFRELFFSVLK